ncbi:MAG: anthranilate synthase component I family protein, partial [Pirellulaceae bacterium]
RLGGGWLGNFDSLGFRQAIDRAREYIYAGDIFQVNLSQRLMRPAGMASIALYRRLREVNPAPFAGYWDGGPFQIISASPERFLQVRERLIETRPIKGTRRRTGNRQHDDEQRQQLLTSTKDRAENTMILDLLRNDLSRICEADSIRVPQWYAIEEYPFVTHAVSVVQGYMRPNASMTDLVRATFPGGSITGAPKVRAMEIIA